MHTELGRIPVWPHRNNEFHKGMEWAQQRTATFGGGGVTVCGCISFNCKIDSHFLQGNVNIVAYYDNVINAHVVPHFDNHPLADMPIFMHDNTRPLRACIVRECRQQDVVDKFQWPAMSPIEQVWYFIGLKVNHRNP